MATEEQVPFEEKAFVTAPRNLSRRRMRGVLFHLLSACAPKDYWGNPKLFNEMGGPLANQQSLSCTLCDRTMNHTPENWALQACECLCHEGWKLVEELTDGGGAETAMSGARS